MPGTSQCSAAAGIQLAGSGRFTPLLRKGFPAQCISLPALDQYLGATSTSQWPTQSTALQQRQLNKPIGAQSPAWLIKPRQQFKPSLPLPRLAAAKGTVVPTPQSRVLAKAFRYWQQSQLGLGMPHHGQGSSGRADQSTRTFPCLKIQPVKDKHLQQWSLFEQAAREQRLEITTPTAHPTYYREVEAQSSQMALKEVLSGF